MLNTSAAKGLPTHDCHRNLPNMFADYFDSKVQRISASFPTTIADPVNADQLYRGRSWTWTLWIFSNNINWTKLTYKVHGKNVVLLGPHPWISEDGLFFCSLACLVNMINLSFKDGLVPVLFKEALLDPVIKKDSLDHEIYPNYRPISNLRLLSKATEKVVALRLTDNLEDNNFLETFQSAYKKWHSTETALTQINDDLLRAIDDDACAILVLLDLSAPGFWHRWQPNITHTTQVSLRSRGQCTGLDALLSLKSVPICQSGEWLFI